MATPTPKDSYITSPSYDDFKIDAANDRVGHVYIASDSYEVGQVDIKVYRIGSPGNITVTVQTASASGYKPDGVDLVTPTTFDGNAITDSSSGEWVEIAFPDTGTIVSGTRYAIIISGASTDGSNYVEWVSDDGFQSYAGQIVTSSNAGSGWNRFINWGLMFKAYEAVPEKAITPAPEDEETQVSIYEDNLTWIDGGDTDTFNIYFGIESGNLTELYTEQNVDSPTWPAPYTVLEIKDYNPAEATGYREPKIGDVLTHDDTTYTLWDLVVGDLVDVQYEAQLWAFRVGPVGLPGDVLTNEVEPDIEDPQAVSVTLNDQWHFHGEVESVLYPFATRYYWRIDSVNESGTTTGDEWYFDTQFSSLFPPERYNYYDPDKNWGYDETTGEYQWADIHTSGGGRYKQQLVAVGHKTIYFGSI